MIKIKLDDSQVLGAFSRLERRGDNLLPLFQDIGEHLAESTHQRFATSTGPEGKRWKRNKRSTLERYLGKFKSSTTKAGKLSKRGRIRALHKRPLVGETHDLSRIHYHASRNRVEIGTSPIYSAVQQFGAKKGSLATGHYKTREGSFPIPWGDIPARPFLGLSTSDRRTVLDLLERYLNPR